MSTKTSHMLVFVGMSLVLVIFQSVAGQGLRDITNARVPGDKLLFGMPLVFLWLVLEVGIVEEFFFRVLLQSRLSAALRSELGGIVLMSVIFGLVHAPGLYLRTSVTHEGLAAHPSFLMAVGYSIVITSVAGFFLGVFWAQDSQLSGAHSGSRRHRPVAQHAAHTARLPHSEIASAEFHAPNCALAHLSTISIWDLGDCRQSVGESKHRFWPRLP